MSAVTVASGFGNTSADAASATTDRIVEEAPEAVKMSLGVGVGAVVAASFDKAGRTHAHGPV